MTRAALTLLAVAAGCVDAVSFLGFGRVLTAAMTGNTVLLGIALGQADLQGALRSGVALCGFFAGVLLGASIVERRPDRTWSPATSAALAIELLLLIGLAVAWHLFGADAGAILFAMIAAAGLAMGIQSAVAHRLGIAGVATTYVTGTLTSLGSRLVGRLRRHGPRQDPIEAQPSGLLAGIWLGYGLGAASAGATRLWWPDFALPPAITDALGEPSWPSAALLLPSAIVAGVILTTAIGQRRRRAGA